LLDGLSMYGGEKSPYGDYLKMASTYIDKHGQKHEIPAGAPIPPGGKFPDVSSVLDGLFYTISRNLA
jgi:hypothetical protein